MKSLWLYTLVSRLRPLSYRGKIMLMAFVGTHIPLLAAAAYVALQGSSDWRLFLASMAVTLFATLVGTAVTLFVLHHLLRPVLATAEALRAYRETRTIAPLPEHFSDDAGRLMADAHQTIAHLDRTVDLLEHIDEITGLPNSKKFLALLEERLARHERFVVVAVNFADFVRLASSLDLPQAQHAMREIAARLGGHLMPANTLACINKSFFAFVLDSAQDHAAGHSPDSGTGDLATRLQALTAACSAEIALDGLSLKPTLHCGVAMHPLDEAGAEILLNQSVSSALNGSDQAPVVFHSPQSRKLALERFNLEQELRRAYEREEFELHFQPVVDIQAGRPIGAEALIRWRHPSRGMVQPGHFIPAAESSGLIEPIGLWVMREACAQVRRWNESGRADLRLAVNLSARQFLDPDIARVVLRTVEQAGIAPSQLEIELTETSAMVNLDHTARVFGQLREAGVGISIDDFGTGYASMSYLRKLPFDKLKIDREFVTDVHRLRQGQAICGALLELAQGLDLKVVAEGVEAESEVRYLQKRGCRLFQGYYFSRPVPRRSFEALLDSEALIESA